MRGKKILRGIGWVLGTLVVLRIALAFVWPTINDVRTGATPEYPDLQIQHFTQDYERVYDAALAAAKNQQWEITAQDREHGEIRAVATSRLWHFKDDVTLSITRSGKDCLVDMRSHSRVGKGDLGANARRIRAFQADLAQRF